MTSREKEELIATLVMIAIVILFAGCFFYAVGMDRARDREQRNLELMEHNAQRLKQWNQSHIHEIFNIELSGRIECTCGWLSPVLYGDDRNIATLKIWEIHRAGK